MIGRTMTRSDGEAHQRLRKAAEEPLRPKTVRQRWHQLLSEIANDLIDGLVDRGECEIMGDFTGPFAARTLKYVMGLNTASDDEMQGWTRDMIAGIGNYADDPDVWARAERTTREIDRTVEENLRRVRGEPDGTILSAEFLAEVGDPSRFSSADALAAAARLVPATRQSGGTSFRRRVRRGNRTLQDLFYRSAYCSTAYHAPSEAFYDRKRAEGKVHRQAVIALARRRVGVLWAMLRDGQLYEDRAPAAA